MATLPERKPKKSSSARASREPRAPRTPRISRDPAKPSKRLSLAEAAKRARLIEPARTAHDADEGPQGIRLQKVMASAGVGSRRLCEQLIEQGSVRVNGRVVNRLPAWVDPADDEIIVEGKKLPKADRRLYVMLYKPRETMSTLSDPEGRRTVADLVPHPSGIRLYPVGRLDYDTMGLLLMTNDGELANRLTHARYGVTKTYRALVKGDMTDAAIEALQKEIALIQRRESRRAAGKPQSTGLTIRTVSRASDRSVIDITITEGQNRSVRKILTDAGCKLKKLVQIRLGPLSLKGVARAQWRELTRDELRALREATGLVRGGDSSSPASPGGARKKPGRSAKSAPRKSQPSTAPAGAPGINDDEALSQDDVW